MIKILNFTAALLLAVSVSFAQEQEKAELTGDRMEIKNSGEKTIFKGNAKIVRGSNTITSDTMFYYKNNSRIDAVGDVKFMVKNEDGGVISASSQEATYNTKDYSGKLWGGKPVIEYNVKNSTDKIYLYADELYLNKDFQSAKAENNVTIVSSSGTITSDNAFLDKKNNILFMHKDKNKPCIDAYQNDKKANFKADEISLFYNDKTVKMNKNVEGKIIMDELEVKK